MRLQARTITQTLGAVNPDAIIPVVVAVTVVVATLATSLVQAKKARANLAALGERLGLKLETQGRYFKKHRLVGERRGKPAQILSYTTGAGKSQQRWVAVIVSVKATGGLTFSLGQRMPFSDVLARLFRKKREATGDTPFDKKWALTTNQPDFMRAALLPEMREKITQLSARSLASGGRYKLERTEIQYAEQGSFSNAKLCARFEEIAEIVCDLADAVEVYADLQKN